MWANCQRPHCDVTANDGYDWGNYRQNGQTVQGGEFVQCIQKNHEKSLNDLTWGSVQRPQMFERIGCEWSIQTYYDVSSGFINLWYVQRGLCLGGLKILLQPLVQTPLHSYPTTSPNLGKHVPNSSSTLVIESTMIYPLKMKFSPHISYLDCQVSYNIATSRHLLMFPCIGLFPSLESAQVAGRFQGGTERCPSFGSPWAVWHFAEWRAFDMR